MNIIDTAALARLGKVPEKLAFTQSSSGDGVQKKKRRLSTRLLNSMKGDGSEEIVFGTPTGEKRTHTGDDAVSGSADEETSTASQSGSSRRREVSPVNLNLII